MATPIQRLFVNVLTPDIEASARFLKNLFELEDAFTSDWFVHLRAKNGLEIGLLPTDSKILPPDSLKTCQGVLVTFTVDDIDKLYEEVKARGIEPLEAPRNLFYGQRRMLLKEPTSGALLDISSECPPSQEFLDSLKP